MIWELEPGRWLSSRSRDTYLDKQLKHVSTRTELKGFAGRFTVAGPFENGFTAAGPFENGFTAAGPFENGFTAAGPTDSLYIRVTWCCDQKMRVVILFFVRNYFETAHHLQSCHV